MKTFNIGDIVTVANLNFERYSERNLLVQSMFDLIGKKVSIVEDPYASNTQSSEYPYGVYYTNESLYFDGDMFEEFFIDKKKQSKFMTKRVK